MCIDMKKNNTYTHFSAVLHFCSLAIAICVMAFAMNSCQEEEFGFTKEEIHQVAVERDYNKEFHKEFPVVDPNHTWMCEPDTVYYNMAPQTRATSQPIVSDADLNNPLVYTISQVESVLDYMKEAENNTGKTAQSFEYVAFEDQTYDIYPVFWGRKFCDYNEVGVYWVDAQGNHHELKPFWSDRDNKIKVSFENTSYTETMPNTTNQITDDPSSTYGKERPYTHDGHSVSNYSFPHYTITVTAGTKWGLYLKTNKTQSKPKIYTCNNCNTEYTTQPNNWNSWNNSGICPKCNRNNSFRTREEDIQRITWYSNANYNPDNTKAAATFHYVDKTYCAFEDAPHECTNASGTGYCTTCGYGHYDHDFNDIILYISPRPYETTFQSIKYRVMCEDLGGSFDWDFNDVVYDVIYEEHPQIKDIRGNIVQSESNATVSIVLQAVGGTLPVSIYYDGSQCTNNNGIGELHQIINGRQPNEKGLYEPINVGEGNHNLAQKVIWTRDLGKTREPNMDIRDYVQHISIRVQQDPKEAGTTMTVKFPEAPKNDNDVIPQCFMTSTKTDWADELQPITEKYSHFEGWVMQQGSHDDWWKEGLGGTEQNEAIKQ